MQVPGPEVGPTDCYLCGKMSRRMNSRKFLGQGNVVKLELRKKRQNVRNSIGRLFEEVELEEREILAHLDRQIFVGQAFRLCFALISFAGQFLRVLFSTS